MYPLMTVQMDKKPIRLVIKVNTDTNVPESSVFMMLR
jgi:hypothetical protein